MNLLDILFPKRCVGCGALGCYFCDRCKKTTRFIRQNEAICPVCEKPAVDGVTHPRCQGRFTPDGLTSLFRYDGVVKKAIKAIKYRFVSDLASEFVSLVPTSLLSPLIANHESRFDRGERSALVPIPLHPSRLRFRGFNQAEELGKYMAARLHIPIVADMLRRTGITKPQVEMKHRKDRLRNMDGVFAVQQGFDKKLIDQHRFKASKLNVLLFDDVFTTGATMRAAANVLKRAGIERVWAVTMAR